MKTALIFVGLVVLVSIAVGLVSAALAWPMPSVSIAERSAFVVRLVGLFAIGSKCTDLAVRMGSK